MLTLDLSEFERAARRVGDVADQLPFAISLALNKTAAKVEDRLAKETWAQHTANRNKGFFKAAMAIDRATKRKLSVALYDQLGRGKLKLHVKGGTASAKGKFAIPTKNVRRGSKGVVASMKPRALPADKKVVKGGLIFLRKGRGKNEKLQLLYKLAPSVRIKADVPLDKDFDRFFRAEIREQFQAALARALATRR